MFSLVHVWRFGVTVLLSLCTGCGGQLTSPSTQPRIAAQPSSGSPTPQPDSADQLLEAPRVEAQAARRFVRLALSYNSRSAPATGFIRGLRTLVTPAEEVALRRSERARLDWQALRARDEAVTVRVTGTSRWQTAGASPSQVVVNGERNTRTVFGVVRDFVQVLVTLTRTGAGWLVSAASGGGL